MLIQQYQSNRNILIVVIALLFSLNSCQEESPEPISILEEDVVLAIEGAILPNSGGLISQINATALQGLTAADLGCDVLNDSSLNEVINSRNSYSYTWTLENECDLEDKPFELTSILDGNRRYLTNDLSANEKIETSIYLSGLSNLENEFTINLITDIEGSYRASNDILDGYVGKISFVGIDIIVDGESQEISSGTANFVFSGASISGRFFNYEGVLTFEGNESASIAFTNGGNYSLNW